MGETSVATLLCERKFSPQIYNADHENLSNDHAYNCQECFKPECSCACECKDRFIFTSVKPVQSIESDEMNCTPTDTSPNGSTSALALPQLDTSRTPSRASSVMSSLSSITATPPPPGTYDGASDVQPPPAKRRKLTFAEKQEKEVKSRDAKAQKDAEKAVEKAKRDEKKRIQQEVKEVKEAAIRQKEEEKAKRERAQPKLSMFFSKPKPSVMTYDASLAGQGLLEAHNNSPASSRSHSTTAQIIHSKASEYEQNFLPFHAPANSVIAPYSRFTWDDAANEHFTAKATSWLHNPESPQGSRQHLVDVLDLTRLDLLPRRWNTPTAKDAVAEFFGLPVKAVDRTSQSSSLHESPFAVLRSIPMKYLFFDKDVRPPYIGTRTKIDPTKKAANIVRNPFKRSCLELDYDEDSEAEWEEPGEGDDIDLENESDSDSGDDGEDLQAFLDDEEADGRHKKRIYSGDMIPSSTGLCWENESGDSQPIDKNTSLDLLEYRMELLCDNLRLPIDPFSTYLWPMGENTTIQSAVSAFVKPPKGPLQLVPDPIGNGSLNTDNTLGIPVASTKLKTKPSSSNAKTLSGKELEEFKKAVCGDDLNDMAKAGLLAVLKKRFPKYTNPVLTETFNAVAVKEGAKGQKKKWVIKD